MRRVSLLVAAAVAIASLTACDPVVACTDGSHSTSHGRGTCAGHGGIKVEGRRG